MKKSKQPRPGATTARPFSFNGKWNCGYMKLEPIDKLIHFLYCLRQNEGLPEISFLIPFDTPEKRDRPEYIPFVWHPIVNEIMDEVQEYVRAKDQRKSFVKNVKQYNPTQEIDDLFKDYKNLIEKLCNLSALAQESLRKHGFNLDHFLTLDRAFFSLSGSLKELQKPGKGRPKEPEKEALLDRFVQILRLHIGRIPERKSVEDLCKAIFGGNCSFDAERAVRRAYKEPLPSDVLLWLGIRGIDPARLPEGTCRWRIFSEACKAIYDRPERLRRGTPPLSEETRKKLYRSIWSR